MIKIFFTVSKNNESYQLLKASFLLFSEIAARDYETKFREKAIQSIPDLVPIAEPKKDGLFEPNYMDMIRKEVCYQK